MGVHEKPEPFIEPEDVPPYRRYFSESGAPEVILPGTISTDKPVPVVVYVAGERKVIGSATVKDGQIQMTLSDLDESTRFVVSKGQLDQMSIDLTLWSPAYKPSLISDLLKPKLKNPYKIAFDGLPPEVKGDMIWPEEPAIKRFPLEQYYKMNPREEDNDS